MKFKAVMCDFDGTITNPGVNYPSEKMARVLIETAKRVPVAICSGREMASFKLHGIEVFEEYLNEGEGQEFWPNFYFVAENGGIGYRYVEGEYVPFYEDEWPDDVLGREYLMDLLAARIVGFGGILCKHRVPIVLHANHGESIEETREHSAAMHQIAVKALEELLPDYEKHFHVGDSGIGVLIVPAGADKDNGVKRFGEFLGLGGDFREILVIGDSAERGGNDYYFLNGRYGTAYTVGSYDQGLEWPRPVQRDGERLMNEEGTMFLLEKA
ncbi:hypothetical protein KJ632_03645 [Patescibacteria group bacterium]|nr:hypothetical protein [Patescibacteria group bacterium]